MDIQPVPAMTAVPPFPALSDRALGTYNSKAYSFGTHLSVTFNGQLLAVAQSAHDNATAAHERAVIASNWAAAASDSAVAANDSAGDASTSAGQAEAARAAALVAAAAAGAAAGLPTYAGKANNPLWVKGDETGPEWDGIKSVGGVALKGAGDIPLNTTPAVAVAALDIDCSAGVYFTKTIAGSSTFTFSNPPVAGTAFAFVLELTHTSGTVAWPAGVRWPENTAPTLTTGRTHIFVFVTDDGGARWRASVNPNYTT